MKLSELKPEDIESVEPAPGGGALKLSDLSPEEIQVEPPESAGNQFETAVDAFGKGASFGYTPQLYAATSVGLDKLKKGRESLADTLDLDFLKTEDQKLREQGFKIDTPEVDYVSERDQFIKRSEGLKEENPVTAAVGQIAGGVVSGIALSPLAKVKALHALGRVKEAAKIGAAYGLISNPGDIEGVNRMASLEGVLEEGQERAIQGLVGAAMGGAIQGSFEGGRKVAQGAKWLGDQLDDVLTDAGKKVRPGVDTPKGQAVEEAAERLGFEATPGMKMGNQTIKGMESSLEQSPTIGGAMMRKQTEPVREGLAKASRELVEDAGSLSQYQAGEMIKREIGEEVAENVAPAQMVFDEMADEFRHIGVSKPAMKRISNSIMKIKEVRVASKGPAGRTARSIADDLGNVESLDDLRTLRGVVGNRLNKARVDRDGEAIGVLKQIYKRITKLEENSIKRAVLQNAGSKQQGTSYASEMLGELKGAKKAYREAMEDMGKTAKLLGLRKADTPRAFTEAIDDVPSETVLKRFSDWGNHEKMSIFKDRFPKLFTVARERKLHEMATKATLPDGRISAPKLLNEVKRLTPEAQEMIFGSKEGLQKFLDLQTVRQSMPKMMGPSGTPQGMEFTDIANVFAQAKSLPRYGLYKYMTSSRAPKNAQFLQSLGDSKALTPGASAKTRSISQMLEFNSRRKNRKLKPSWARDYKPPRTYVSPEDAASYYRKNN